MSTEAAGNGADGTGMSLSRLRHVLALSTLMLGVSVPVASAAPLRMTFTDPVDTPAIGLDLTSGTIEQDVVSGKIDAHIEWAGNVPAGPAAVRIQTGAIGPTGDCLGGEAKSIVILARLDFDSVIFGVGLPPAKWATTATETRAANAIDITVPGDPATAVRPATCALVDGGPTGVGSGFNLTSNDQVTAAVVLAPTQVAGQTAGASPTSDKDGDGKADVVDACPTSAGAGVDGCPPAGKTAAAMRLGARRIVIDRPLAKLPGASACPTKVKVVVKQNGHRLGAGKLPVTDTAGVCSVKGALRLKRHAKRSYVFVAISAPGLTSVLEQIRT